jgi:hypothetical protein
VDKHFELEDGIKILEFFMPGRPATKKTSQRIVRRRILPSERYENYEKSCKEIFESVWKDKGEEPISCGVSVKITITTNTWVIGDQVGYQQAIGDILEKYKIVRNDILIHWADFGKHMITEPDKNNPGCKIEIFRFRHPLETRTNFFERFSEKDKDQVLKKKAKKTTNAKKTKPKRKTIRKKL